jgi:hypothetical protein
MKFGKFVLSLLAVAAVTVVIAQGPLYDKVIVDLPYRVTINETVLEPGTYTIRQHESSGGGSRVLHIFGKDGMKLETTAMTIPALDNRTPEDTKVILHHLGSDYYFDKIWIQGKNYGYEFVLPDSVRNRQLERAEPASIVARYEPMAQETAVAQSTTTTTTTTTEERAVTQEQVAQAAPPPPPPAVAEPAPAPEPVTAAPEPVAAAPVAEPAPEAADRPAMPATAANWLNLLLGGASLSGAGLALSRFRRQ